MNVYVLLNGCYSDEHISGVFSTMADAELAAKIFTDDAHIEEWAVDHEIELMRRGAFPYFVRLNRHTGDVMDAHRQDSSYGVWSTAVGEDIHKNLYTHVWALNDQQAIKIAGDRRRMLLALPQADDAVDPQGGKTPA